MKKHWLVLLLLAAVTLTPAIWINPVTAFFSHKDTEAGMEAAAGVLEIDVEAKLTPFGVPGDVLKNGSLTITNKSPIPVDYELWLTADTATAELLNKEILSKTIQLYNQTTLLDTTPSLNADGSLVLVYNSTLTRYETQQLTVELALEGAALPRDGNEYQSQHIKLTHEVTAYQTEGD